MPSEIEVEHRYTTFLFSLDVEIDDNLVGQLTKMDLAPAATSTAYTVYTTYTVAYVYGYIYKCKNWSGVDWMDTT